MAEDTPRTSGPSPDRRITVRDLRRWTQAGEPFPMLTCYDATTAGWLWRGGIRVMLVGDTAGQMILGLETTLGVTMDVLVALTAAVRRGAPNAYVMADMPFGSYQCGDDEAMANAVRFLTEGGADSVKLEVDVTHAPLVKRMTAAGIPVVAHIGARPQQVRQQGRAGSVGRKAAEAKAVVDSAGVMLEHGAHMLLIEAVPQGVSEQVVKLAGEREGAVVPVIGCGAGPACHGHVVVLHDLVGLTDWQPPFVKPTHALGEQFADAARQWGELVRSGSYLRDNHPYVADV